MLPTLCPHKQRDPDTAAHMPRETARWRMIGVFRGTCHPPSPLMLVFGNPEVLSGTTRRRGAGPRSGVNHAYARCHSSAKPPAPSRPSAHNAAQARPFQSSAPSDPTPGARVGTPSLPQLPGWIGDPHLAQQSILTPDQFQHGHVTKSDKRCCLGAFCSPLWEVAAYVRLSAADSFASDSKEPA